MDLLASSVLVTTPLVVSKSLTFCYKCQCFTPRKSALLRNNIRVESQPSDSSTCSKNEEDEDEDKEGLDDNSLFPEGIHFRQIELDDAPNKSGRSIRVARSDIAPNEAKNSNTKDEGSSVEVISGPKYVMSSPVIESSSQIALVRSEIERRVTEQLLKNQSGLHPVLSIHQITENSKSTSPNEREEEKLERKPLMVSDEDLSYHVMDIEPQSSSIVTAENESEEVQLKSTITMPNAFYEKMVGDFEREVVSLQDQLVHVNKELHQQEKLLGIFNEKLTKDLHELSDKIYKRLDETIGREDVNRINESLIRNINGLQTNYNGLQSQITSSASTLETIAMETIKLHEQYERGNADVQSKLKRLTEWLNQLEIMQDNFAAKSIHVQLRKVEDVVSNIEQKQQQCQIQFNEMESHVQSSIREMKDYIASIDQRGRVLELSDRMSKICNKLDRENKLSQSWIESLDNGFKNNKANILLLQEEWRQLRKEIISEISDLKNELSSSSKTTEDSQLKDLQKEISDIKNVLNTLKEEVKLNSDSALEAERKVSILEAKGLELIKQIMEDGETKQHEILDDVRSILDGKMLKNVENERYGEKFMVDDDGVALISDNKMVYPAKDNYGLSRNEHIQLSIHTQTFLESLFAVIGQVIRHELERMNANPDQPSLLPLAASGDALKSMVSKSTITLVYNSNWRATFLHYCVDNIQWTEIPGVPMEDAVFNGKQMKMLRVTANRMEFVLTDGQGNWDKASDGCNYVIEGPGVFELSEGILVVAHTTQ